MVLGARAVQGWVQAAEGQEFRVQEHRPGGQQPGSRSRQLGIGARCGANDTHGSSQ